MRLRPRRVGFDRRCEMFQGARHVASADRRAARDQWIAVAHLLDQRVVLDRLPARRDGLLEAALHQQLEGRHVRAGGKIGATPADWRSSPGRVNGCAGIGRPAELLRRRDLEGREHGWRGRRVAAFHDVPRDLVTGDGVVRLQSRGPAERTYRVRRTAGEIVHHRGEPVHVGAARIQRGSRVEGAPRVVQAEAIQVDRPQRGVRLGIEATRAQSRLEARDGLIPAAERRFHGVDVGTQPAALVADAAGQRDRQVADGGHEHLFALVDLGSTSPGLRALRRGRNDGEHQREKYEPAAGHAALPGYSTQRGTPI